MTPRKLKVAVATFSYGGNGGMKSEHPDVRDWLLETVPKIKADPRVEAYFGPPDKEWEFADTPVTMCRNKAVATARKYGVDALLMVDSDAAPDLYVGADPSAVPFWDVAFDFLYDRWAKGPVVVGAPYCGPPPFENVYGFRWRNRASDEPGDSDIRLDQYTRDEAFELRGIQEAAALPTGLILFDVRVFDLIEPHPSDAVATIMARLKPRWDKGERFSSLEEVENLVRWVVGEKDRLSKPWFYYEYPDHFETEKVSTEDCTVTRDISLTGLIKLGYNPIHMAWSSWAGHWKPKCVGRPSLLTADSVSEKLRRAMEARLPHGVGRIEVKTNFAKEIDWNAVAPPQVLPDVQPPEAPRGVSSGSPGQPAPGLPDVSGDEGRAEKGTTPAARSEGCDQGPCRCDPRPEVRCPGHPADIRGDGQAVPGV